MSRYADSGTKCEAVTTKTLQVPMTLGQLNEEVSRLEGIVESLYKRLDTVIRREPESANVANTGLAPKQCLVDVANQIEDKANRISFQVGKISTLLGLLEL